MKRTVVISLSVLVLFFVALLALPVLYEKEINLKIKHELNSLFDAHIQYSDADLSFIRSFPHVSISLQHFEIVGKNEFQNDTLLAAPNLHLTVNLGSFFGSKAYEIKKLVVDEPTVHVVVLPSGKANWEIWKTDTTQVADTSKMAFAWKLEKFEIVDAHIVYDYQKANMKFVFKKLNHTLSGNLTADSSMLDTRTKAESVTYMWDNVAYVTDAKAELNALIDANLNAMHFEILENNSTLNELAFTIKGWFKSIPDGWDMDLSVSTPTNDFKSILSMVPALYAGNFKEIKTGGSFGMHGKVKGLLVGDYYPAFDLQLRATDGWFQYPALPDKLEKISATINLTNPGRTLDDTQIDVSDFSFVLAGNPFGIRALIKNPMTDTYLSAEAKGKLNLSKIKDMYPLNENTTLSGLLTTHMQMEARQSALTQQKYDQIQFSGNLHLEQFEALTSFFSQNIRISRAQLKFNNNYVDMPVCHVVIGKNDLSASGKIEHLLGYVLNNQTLKGQFTVQSNYLNISDFIPASAVKDTSHAPLQIIRIPQNIDFTMQAAVDKLLFDNMAFDRVSGTLRAANGTLNMQQVTLDGFGGKVVMNGVYSTADSLKPHVSMQMQLHEIGFENLFRQVNAVQKLLPILGKAAGKFSTNVNFSSAIQNNMMPDLNSIISSGSLKTNQVGLKNIPAIETLASKLNQSDLMPLIIRDLALFFEIKNGKINTKPFQFNVKNMRFTAGGSTGLDQSIAYSGSVQLPDHLQAGKLSTIRYRIGGTFTKPTVELDLKNTINQLVEQKREQVTSEVNRVLTDTKAKALDQVNKQKEAAIKAAQQQAEALIVEAEKKGNLLIDEAQKQGRLLIEKAGNPITKRAAEIAARKLEDAARKQAATIVQSARNEAEKIIHAASQQTN